MAVNPIPNEHQSVVPYPIIKGVPVLIEFLEDAFSANVVHRVTQDDGSVMHAQVKVGDTAIMMGEAGEDYEPRPVSLYMYVSDVDEIYQRALDAGAASVMEPAEQFYGDRMGGVRDPVGNIWWIASRLEELSSEELQTRMSAKRLT